MCAVINNRNLYIIQYFGVIAIFLGNLSKESLKLQTFQVNNSSPIYNRYSEDNFRGIQGATEIGAFFKLRNMRQE